MAVPISRQTFTNALLMTLKRHRIDLFDVLLGDHG